VTSSASSTKPGARAAVLSPEDEPKTVSPPSIGHAKRDLALHVLGLPHVTGIAVGNAAESDEDVRLAIIVLVKPGHRDELMRTAAIPTSFRSHPVELRERDILVSRRCRGCRSVLCVGGTRRQISSGEMKRMAKY
jgi:hypothetical protein